MRTLHDSILRDVMRVLDHHQDITPDFKTRLQGGLLRIDDELHIARDTGADPQPEPGENALDYAERRNRKGGKR